MNIDPKILKIIRNAKGLTFKEMKKRSGGLSIRNLKKLESDKEGKNVKPNKRTIEGLCKALGVEPGHLSGELDLSPEIKKKVEGEPTRRSVSLRFGRKQELELIQRVYGVSAEQVINMAPFLFVLMAEGSLKWRKQKLAAFRKAVNDCKGANHLAFVRENYQNEDYLSYEDYSIDRKDVFGKRLQEFWPELGEAFFDPNKGNPFSDYLCKLTDEVFEGDKGAVDILTSDPHNDGDELPSYSLLEGEMKTICRNNDLCREAIRWGDFSIRDIPDDLSDIEEFNAWVDANTSQNTKDLEASFKKIALEL